MQFMKSIFLDFWRYWLDFDDAVPRKKFWPELILWSVICGIVYPVLAIFLSIGTGIIGIAALVILSLFVQMPFLALLNRRLNDTGMAEQISHCLILAFCIFSWFITPASKFLEYGAVVLILLFCLVPTNYLDH